MARIKFSDKQIQGMKPDAKKRKQVFDSEQPGLALRVTPDGTKSFSVVYKINGRMRRLTLGKYPSLTLKTARDKAHDALTKVNDGKDPMAQKAAERIAGNFGELSEFYMEEHSKVKKRSWPEDQRMLDAYVLPEWKYTRASAITIDDAESLIEAVARRGPVQANRVRALLRHLFTWALQTRKHRTQFLLTLNPCAYVARQTDESARTRVYTDPEIKKIWAACSTGEVGIVGDLFKLQLLTAVRKGELVKMEWGEVDLDNAVWTLPAEKTKNGKVHVVPLSNPAGRILETLKRRQDKLKNKSKKESKFVFHSSRTGAVAMTWLQKAADRVKDESGIEDFHAHDLRRTTATRLAKASVPDPVLKMILNHSLGKDVTGVYNQYKYFEERKLALDAWASKVMTIVSDLKAVDRKRTAKR